jgi:hypothetical protein
MEWHRQLSPQKNKYKVQNSPGKVMACIFWDSEGIFVVEILETGATVLSEQ